MEIVQFIYVAGWVLFFIMSLVHSNNPSGLDFRRSAVWKFFAALFTATIWPFCLFMVMVSGRA